MNEDIQILMQTGGNDGAALRAAIEDLRRRYAELRGQRDELLAEAAKSPEGPLGERRRAELRTDAENVSRALSRLHDELAPLENRLEELREWAARLSGQADALHKRWGPWWGLADDLEPHIASIEGVLGKYPACEPATDAVRALRSLCADLRRHEDRASQLRRAARFLRGE